MTARRSRWSGRILVAGCRASTRRLLSDSLIRGTSHYHLQCETRASRAITRVRTSAERADQTCAGGTCASDEEGRATIDKPPWSAPATGYETRFIISQVLLSRAAAKSTGPSATILQARARVVPRHRDRPGLCLHNPSSLRRWPHGSHRAGG